MNTLHKLSMMGVLFALLLSSGVIYAQPPEKINYMAVARNSHGEVLSNHSLGVRVSILQNSEIGNAIYSELFNITTNDYGIFHIGIGSGSPINGEFQNISWGQGIYYIQIEIDISGEGDFIDLGASQILSVPYALYAKQTADTFSGDYNDLTNTPEFLNWDTLFSDDVTLMNPQAGDMLYYDGTNWNGLGKGSEGQVLQMKNNIPAWEDSHLTVDSSHSIGDFWGGGIVFHTYDNGNHGLIVSVHNMSDAIGWGGSGTNITAGNGAASMYNGLTNTESIVAELGAGTYAANLCYHYSNDGYDDWYLPSIWELNTLFNSAAILSKLLEEDGDPTSTPFYIGQYWSSTEDSNNIAWFLYFSDGGLARLTKTSTYQVRAIRQF